MGSWSNLKFVEASIYSKDYCIIILVFSNQNFGGYSWMTIGWELAFVHSIR